MCLRYFFLYGIMTLKSNSLSARIRAFFVFILMSTGLYAQVPQISIFPELTGNELLDALADAYRPNQVFSYDNARDIMFTQTHNLDGEVFCVYTNDVILIATNDSTPRNTANNHDPNWNTEHIYPQSKGASANPARSDIHHLYPIRADVNSSRGNSPFGFVATNLVTRWWKEDQSQMNIPADAQSGEWSRTYGSIRFEPRDAKKGDMARAVYYFYTMYRDQANAADPTFFQQMFEDLREFHNMDPVDMLEYDRTLAIGVVQQHDGNPFILDTTLVTRAFYSGDFEFDSEIAEGDYFANFEAESKPSGYVDGPVSLSGVVWNLNNALIGTDAADMKIGTKSARLRHQTDAPASLVMNDFLPNGLGTISFLYARSNFSNDRNPTAPTFVVEYTTDSKSADPVNWTQLGDPISLDGIDVLQEFRYDLQEPNPGRIRIRSISGSNGRRFNIDNIFITEAPELKLTREVSGVPGWRFLTSPTQNATFADLLEGTFFTQGFPGTDAPSGVHASNVILYDEESGSFVSPSNLNDPIGAGVGFALAAFPDVMHGSSVDKTISLNGHEHAEMEVALSYTPAGGSGWNLVGNPFAVAYPVSELGIESEGDINENIYIWDANLGDYVVLSATDEDAEIGAFQAFFVKAEAGGQSLFFDRNERRSKPGNFLKTSADGINAASMASVLSGISFEIVVESEETFGAMKLQFDNNGSYGFISRDAYRLESWNANFSYPYVLKSDTPVATAFFPADVDFPVEIPLHYRSSATAPVNVNMVAPYLSDYIVVELHQTLEEGGSISWNLRDESPEIQLLADSLRGNAAKMGYKLPAPDFGFSHVAVVNSSASTPFTLVIYPDGLSADATRGVMPGQLKLHQNYPNPFNPSTRISFNLPSGSHTSLIVYDVLGREVAKLVNETLPGGQHSVVFDASALSSGVYLYRLRTESGVITRTMTLVK